MLPHHPRRSRPPSRLLAWLTAAVLLVHWAVLGAAPLAVASDPGTPAPASFSTRTIALPDTLSDVTPAKPSAVPAPRPRPVPQRSRASTQNSEQNTASTHASIAQAAIKPIAPEVPAAPTARADSDTVLLADASAPNAAAPASGSNPARTANSATSSSSASAPAAAAARHYVFPAPVRLKYDIKGESKGIPYFASGELLWQHDGHSYDARMEISILMFSRIQTSTGQLSGQGLQPTRFGDKVRSEVAAHFERTKDKVSFSANTPDVALLPGAQDQLSVFMQLAAMLAGAPGQVPSGTTLPFQAIGPRSAESWVFTVEASEKLDLPGGEVTALKLTREPAVEYGPRAEIWLAPNMDYMPVRIRLTQANGDLVDQRWRASEKP